MMLSFAGRVAGPAATLVLLAFLAGFPPAYTAQYAVLAAYMQLATAPLNPYTEHFHLRELMSGRKSGFGVGLAGFALLWVASALLVLMLSQPAAILAVVPLLGLGHLMLKILAARIRANRCNGLAIALEFSLRPVTLLILTVFLFLLLGPSTTVLNWAFSLTGGATIAVAVVVFVFVSAAQTNSEALDSRSEVTAQSSPWSFLLLGMLMVLATQFEVFALDRLASDEVLATYKVSLQLASVCGIATNFILMNNLRELYATNILSFAYKRIFRKVQLQTLSVSAVFMLGFSSIGFIYPVVWARETWLLAAGAAFIFAVSAAFGPVGNWLYAAGRLRIIMLSLFIMLVTKVLLFIALSLAGAVSPVSMIIVFGIGTVTHNSIMLRAKNKYSRTCAEGL
ncbi:hypothetical protein SAMN05216571_103320 [Onishia taeanensis]|uniref:Uncharacterized protein n=1 Tax=Onishia taeanensis TaxID=284577 RepID=A0A1G7QL27_9GAMM|nr:hypothetical protein [Halomonas taeanensis]SDF99251.1 hypothetical protein SAMN05216571_103320 [Halomonas taeanensis]